MRQVHVNNNISSVWVWKVPMRRVICYCCITYTCCSNSNERTSKKSEKSSSKHLTTHNSSSNVFNFCKFKVFLFLCLLSVKTNQNTLHQNNKRFFRHNICKREKRRKKTHNEQKQQKQIYTQTLKPKSRLHPNTLSIRRERERNRDVLM